jgi:pimeloyl-ACP methyl ester carboxylesterase
MPSKAQGMSAYALASMGILTMALGLACSSESGTEKSSAGRWAGEIGPVEDRRELAVWLRPHGTNWRGTIDVPSAGLIEEPLASVSPVGDSVTFVLATDLGESIFRGRLVNDQIEGFATIGPQSASFSLARVSDPPPTKRELEARFANGDVQLAGTLFLPMGAGPFPAVVFLHASGDQPRLGIGDRARLEAYVRAGIAVLVYDKRGVGSSGGDHRRVGFSELADDGLAAVEWLAHRKEIRGDAIGLDGRSQGAWIAEIAAARSPRIRFVVCQVCGGVPPWRQELHRVEAELRAGGYPEDVVNRALAYTRLHYAVARGDSTWERYAETVARVQGEPWIELKRPWSSLEQARVSWQRIGGFEPGTALATVRSPVLVVLAANDRSTPTEESARALRAMPRPLEAGPIEVRVLTDADHAMLTYPPSGIPRQPAGYPERVVEWVKARV